MLGIITSCEISEVCPNSEHVSLMKYCDFSCLYILLCHRHFHYDDVMIIMLNVSSTNSTTYMSQLESFPLHAPIS